jgi:protein-S-isoprenylcysteine O-methyltransferase Ste14
MLKIGSNILTVIAVILISISFYYKRYSEEAMLLSIAGFIIAVMGLILSLIHNHIAKRERDKKFDDERFPGMME